MQPEQLLQQALAYHRAGRLTEAEQGYRGLLNIRPDSAEIHVSLAQVLMLQGRLDEAAASASIAVKALPRQPIAHSRLGDILALQGKLIEAEAAYRRAVRLKPDFAEVYNNLGNILQQQGKLDEATASYRKAVAAKPQFVEALTNLAAVAVRQGDLADATTLLDRAFAVRKDYAPAYNVLGSARLAARQFEDAIAAFKVAIRLQPGNGEAHNNLGGALESAGRHEEALASYDRAAALLPPDANLLLNVGNVLKAMGRLSEAEAQYRRATALSPGAPQPRQHLAMVICEQGRLDEGFSLFREAAELAWSTPEGSPAYRRKHDEEQAAWSGRNVGQGFHLEAVPRQLGSAIHIADRAGIEARWQFARPQVVVLDDFLAPQALDSLRRFCMGSSIWGKNHSEGYLGAMPETGFAPPLLAQIVEELRAGYPAIFGDLPLLHHWAFKYDSSLNGIKVHADFAAVNVNFWITPDDANCDPDNGGLVIWDVAAPLNWDFESYNSDDGRIRDYLKAQGAKAITVPYRANRAVIFDSDLFHESDTIRFREGYENRRINVTLLYGRRADRCGSE